MLKQDNDFHRVQIQSTPVIMTPITKRIDFGQEEKVGSLQNMVTMLISRRRISISG